MSKTTRQDVLTVLNEPTIKQRADGIMALIGGSEWISVDDRLPENTGIPYTRYLVMHPNRLDEGISWMGIQYWVDDKWDMEGITHWMPLPDPPKETHTPADTG